MAHDLHDPMAADLSTYAALPVAWQHCLMGICVA